MNNRFSKHLFCQGIVKIGDLLSNMGKFLQSPKVLTANLSPTQYFKLIGVVDAIPIAWRLIINRQINFSIHHSSEINYILNWMKLKLSCLTLHQNYYVTNLKLKNKLLPLLKTR